MVRSGILALGSLVAAALSACGSGGGAADPLVCAAGELRYRGDLQGQAVEGLVPVAGQVLENESSPDGCRLRVYLDPTGRLEFAWPVPIALGAPSAASGSLNLEARGLFNVGNCPSDGLSSEIVLYESGARFVLRSMRGAPYCTGEPKQGEIEGCAGFLP